jgi:hypothetical protein
MSFVRKFADAMLAEAKAILREYAHETEVVLKKRLKKLVIVSVVTTILLSLAISSLGTASLFLEIGSLKYLSTMMPEWKAWDIMGLTSAAVGAALVLGLFLIIRKQLSSL